MIFNKLSNYKRSLYYSFIETLGSKASVDVFIYNYDLEQFAKIIDNHISNYDNPVKEILEGGITTISTNHDEIGRTAAEMILTGNFRRIKSPFEFIKRKSL